MNVEIYPLEKVVLDGVVISFGMNLSDVESVLGKGQCMQNRYYYYNNEMAIDYRNDKVEFIEFLGGVDGKLKPTIYGVSVFDIAIEELIRILKKKNNGEIYDIENGYSYQFFHISIGIYRESTPEEVAEIIKEANDFGNPISDEEIAYEMKRANYCATIGSGSVGYYENV